MVIAAHGAAFYPTAAAQNAHVGLAWASGVDQITFGTTDACDTADTYVWKISNATLSFTGGDTDHCGRHQNLIGYDWTKVSTSTSPADAAS
jgi:hypothetical protein